MDGQNAVPHVDIFTSRVYTAGATKFTVKKGMLTRHRPVLTFIQTPLAFEKGSGCIKSSEMMRPRKGKPCRRLLDIPGQLPFLCIADDRTFGTRMAQCYEASNEKGQEVSHTYDKIAILCNFALKF
jgi:hypothetical protein